MIAAVTSIAIATAKTFSELLLSHLGSGPACVEKEKCSSHTDIVYINVYNTPPYLRYQPLWIVFMYIIYAVRWILCVCVCLW